MPEQIIELAGALEFEYSGKLGRETFRGRAALSEDQLARLRGDRKILLSFTSDSRAPFTTQERCRWLKKITREGFAVAIWAEQPLWFGLWRQALTLSEVNPKCAMVFYQRADALDWLIHARQDRGLSRSPERTDGTAGAFRIAS